MDGAFDVMHFGHMNAFRRAKYAINGPEGTFLVVGVNTSASVQAAKGTKPLMDDDERVTAVSACKWVDAVEQACPYVMNSEYIQYVVKKWDIDYIIHGDDPCIVDGKNVYETAIEIGKFREIPRTEGVSTTDIVGRMLRLSNSGGKGEHLASPASPSSKLDKMARRNRQSKFFFTNRMLRLFSQGFTPPPPKARVVYIDGAFDLFHAGQSSMLKKARELGDYLIVGVYR
jgi:ethanolamine-phosphate cytidylyltransferase